MTAATRAAYDLFHQGMITLAEIEENGVGIDVARLESTIANIEKKIKDIKADLKADPLYAKWRKRWGEKTKLTSRPQLGEVLFSPKDRGGMGYKPKSLTETGRWKVDEEELEDIDLPFVQKYVRMAKLEKVLGTNLYGIKRELVGDRCHCNYNLNIPISYRSSCDSFNYQNLPIRNPEFADVIRSLFIPRPGCCLVEIDFSGIEVRTAACYHKDPVMIRYIQDPTRDMHRDMAMQIYFLPETEFKGGKGKMIRHAAKNSFVFPQFYGDYYINNAYILWHRIHREKLVTADGRSLYEVLAAKGIKKLGACDPKQRPKKGTFELHMKEVEDHFWKTRFKRYGQWKQDWYDAYLKRGYFDSLTGFHYEGVFDRNQVINIANQGSAYHCELWSMNQISKETRRRGMKSMIIGQIHDSIISEVPTTELTEYVRMSKKIMTNRLRDHYPWIIVPIEVEVEVAPEGRPWSEKRKY